MNWEVVRVGRDQPLIAAGNTMILAITSDVPIAADVPVLALSNIGALADVVLANAWS